MTTQETAKVSAELTFSTDNGELPDKEGIEQLIADQMSGELDEETGLGCMVVTVTAVSASFDESKILVVGNPGDGFRLIGPVTPNDPALDHYIDFQLTSEDWWYLPVQSLDDAIKEAER